MKSTLLPLLFVLLCVHPPLKAQGCWVQHRASVHEWQCAAQSLPQSGAHFGLSIVVIDTPDVLLVLDSGATANVGVAASRAIVARFGVKPVWLVNTQPKPEHVLGNVGFARTFTPTLSGDERFTDRIVAGVRTAELMKARCPDCIANFAKRMGSDSVVGTESMIPGRLLTENRGDLRVLSPSLQGWVYRFFDDLETEQAFILSNPDLRVFWVGSAVQPVQVPDLYDGNAARRIDFLARLKSILGPQDTLLTSYGPVGPDWVDNNLNYFVELQRKVLAGLEAGRSEVELIDEFSTQIPNDAVYVQTDPEPKARQLEVQQLNIQRLYRQAEDLFF